MPESLHAFAERHTFADIDQTPLLTWRVTLRDPVQGPTVLSEHCDATRALDRIHQHNEECFGEDPDYRPDYSIALYDNAATPACCLVAYTLDEFEALCQEGR